MGNRNHTELCGAARSKGEGVQEGRGVKSANHEQDPAGEEINESSALSGSRNSGFLHKSSWRLRCWAGPDRTGVTPPFFAGLSCGIILLRSSKPAPHIGARRRP